jgi:hypothetical protein
MEIIGGILIVVAGCIGLYIAYNKYNKSKRDKKVSDGNYIPIITKNRSSAISSMFGGNDMIDSQTLYDFTNAYDKMDKDKDITIIIHTHGGTLSGGEAIANFIMMHNFKSEHKGKIKCFIPHFAYSCGFLIALACDEIIMYDHAVIGPCDAQAKVGDGYYSVDSIIDTVMYKINNNEKVNVSWYASYLDAKKCVDRQMNFINKLVEITHFTPELKERVYNEFFSGKYNHDKVFTAEDLIAIGLNVTTVKTIPDDVKAFVKDGS